MASLVVSFSDWLFSLSGFAAPSAGVLPLPVVALVVVLLHVPAAAVVARARAPAVVGAQSLAA